MRRPRAGDDNGDDRYGVRVDETRRHLSSPLLLFSPSPSLLPSLSSSSSSPSSPSCFPSSSSSYLLLLPTAGVRVHGRGGRGAGGARARRALGRGARARGPGSRRGGRAGSRRLRRGGSGGSGAAATARRRGGYGARVCACVVCAWCVCVCPVFFIFQTSLPSARSGALGKESILPSAPDLALGEIKN